MRLIDINCPNCGCKIHIDPERKKGKWIFNEDFRIVDGYDWKCDQCGSWQRYTSNYCPNCGAEME